ncbi:MAG: hypothetical protein ACOC5T_06040 [Elusimicrobiota bacterium]
MGKEDHLEKSKRTGREWLLEIVKDTIRLIEQEDANILNPAEDSSLPLRFEAFSYLAYRYDNLVSEYSDYIRSLWVKWIGIDKAKKKDNGSVFWPSKDEVATTEFGDPVFESYMGLDILNDIAMFRAKNILNITGLDDYFDYRSLSLSFQHLNLPDFTKTQPWQFARVPHIYEYLDELDKYLNLLTLNYFDSEIFENKLNELNEEGKEKITRLIKSIFFRLAVKPDIIFSGDEGKLILKLLPYQKDNGSFFDDIFTTSLFLNSVQLLKLDPNNTIKNSGLNWLISNQNKNGSWSVSEDINLNVVSTAFVLESLDYLTNDAPLPIWAPGTKIKTQEKTEEKPYVRKIPVSKDTTWDEISIHFTSQTEVEIKVRDASQKRNYMNMGFFDQRKKDRETEDSFDFQWGLLRIFAQEKDNIYKIGSFSEKQRTNLRKKIQRLNKTLMDFFAKKDKRPIDTIKAYTYQTKFGISSEEKNDENTNKNSCVKYNEIERERLDYTEKKKKAHKKEILKHIEEEDDLHYKKS